MLGRGLIPTAHCIVVMCSRICNAVRRIVVREEGIIRTRKTELQNLHARQVEAIAQINYVWSDHTEVFGDDRQRSTFPVTECRVKCFEEILPWTRNPTSLLGSGTSERDFIIAREAAEMIEADNIYELQHGAESFQPPGILRLLVRAPLIKWIAPQLTGGREIIRWNTCHDSRQTFLVEEE